MRYKYEILRQGLCSQWYGCHVLSFECIFFYSLELLQMVHDILNTKKWNLNLGSSFECFMAQTGFILQQFVQQPSSAAALMIQSASSSCYLLEAKTLWSPIWWKFRQWFQTFNARNKTVLHNICWNLQQLWILSKLLQNLNILHCCWDQYQNDSTVRSFIFQWLRLRLGHADDDYDIDAPGQFVLAIMMMLLLTKMMMLMLLVNLCSPLWWCRWWRWGCTAEYQLRGQWWKWGLNFTAAVFTSSTPFPSYWSGMELMESILTCEEYISKLLYPAWLPSLIN